MIAAMAPPRAAASAARSMSNRVAVAMAMDRALASATASITCPSLQRCCQRSARATMRAPYAAMARGVRVAWETIDADADQPPAVQDFARIWQAADKIVYSTTLETVASARTRIERVFDPDAIRQMKATADRDLTVGGPGLAAQALKAGLVDECHLFLTPIVVGGGTPALPTGVRLELDLLDERRFAGGVVHLHYRIKT